MVKNAIKVYGRIKKSTISEYEQNYDIRKNHDSDQEIVFNTDSKIDYGIYKNSKQRFRFCKIFDQMSTQTDIFDTVAKPVIDSVLQGYNGTIFAYGQTGSGKTFSMTGSSDYDNRGIIPRTIQYVFNHVNSAQTSTVLFNVYISYLEIYNENGYDLLNPKHRAAYLEDLPRVTLLEDAKGQTHLRNLGVNSVTSEREAMCLLFLGDTNRTIAETPMNLYSSRSHCIFTVYFSVTMPEDGRVIRSKLHLVDLAGSERIQKSSITGSMLIDAKQINLSLHFLEQVIIALSDSKRMHIPYRNSMMTSVLKDSLGGNCLTTMLATLSIEPKNFEETISTCKFAQRVALITSEAYINEDEDPYSKISELKLEIERLKKELLAYKDNTIPINLLNEYEITPDRIKELETEVANYVKGASNSISIETNVNKAHECFKIFKKIISAQTTVISDDHKNMKQISSYQDQIKKQESKIALLVNTLNDKQNSPNSPKTSANKSTQNTARLFTPPNRRTISQKEAFELFLRQDANENEIAKCGSALKEKMRDAKKCASKIQNCKDHILKLKKKLRNNINNNPDISSKLLTQLKSEQELYRETILDLYNLKTEASHLSHGFQQSKRRILQRFKSWWEQDPAKTEVTRINSRDTFSPRSPTEYFMWDPDLSSFNTDDQQFHTGYSPDPFSCVFDSDSEFSDAENQSFDSNHSQNNSGSPSYIEPVKLFSPANFPPVSSNIVTKKASRDELKVPFKLPPIIKQNGTHKSCSHDKKHLVHRLDHGDELLNNLPPLNCKYIRKEVPRKQSQQYFYQTAHQSDGHFAESELIEDEDFEYQDEIEYCFDDEPQSRINQNCNRKFVRFDLNYDIPTKVPVIKPQEIYMYDYQPVYVTSSVPRLPDIVNYKNKNLSENVNYRVPRSRYTEPRHVTISREHIPAKVKQLPEDDLYYIPNSLTLPPINNSRDDTRILKEYIPEVSQSKSTSRNLNIDRKSLGELLPISREQDIDDSAIPVESETKSKVSLNFKKQHDDSKDDIKMCANKVNKNLEDTEDGYVNHNTHMTRIKKIRQLIKSHSELVQNVEKPIILTETNSESKIQNILSSSRNRNDKIKPLNKKDLLNVVETPNADDDNYLNSIPLTGDSEVDEEILTFYRTKQKVLKQC